MQPTNVYSYSDIEAATCGHFRIAPEQLRSQKKDRHHITPRFIAVYLARQFTPLSSPQLGRRLNRDHASILNSERRARQLITQSADFREEMLAVVERLRATRDTLDMRRKAARAFFPIPAAIAATWV
jgi:chromosomal replication initiation ATPase DnaA